MKAGLGKYDVVGKAFGAYLTNFEGTKPSGSFPAGSEAYRVSFTCLADTYRLSGGMEICLSAWWPLAWCWWLRCPG